MDQDTFGAGESSAFCNVENCEVNCIPDNWVSNNLDPEPDCFNLTVNDLSIDECGICNGDNYEVDCIDSDDCSLMDCSGQCFGITQLDECGVCDGDNTSCNVPFAEDFEIELDEDQLSSFMLPITDQNGDPISLEIIFSPLFGNLTFDQTTFSFPYEDTEGNYLPDTEFSGLDEFSYYVVDNQGYESEAATASITVNFVDDSPEGTSIASEVNEDEVLLVELVGSDIDTDDALLSFEIVQNPSHGTLSSVSRLTDQYYYTPSENYHGLDTLLYKVYDGNSYSQNTSVYISVLSVNDAPILTMDNTSLSLNENSSIDMAMNMEDVDGDQLELHILQNPVNGSITNWDPNNATFTYVPNAYFVGLDNITLYAQEVDTDDSLKSTILSVDLNVLAVNDPPVSFNQTISIQEDELVQFNLTGQDIDGDELEFILTDYPDSISAEDFVDCGFLTNDDGTTTAICENDDQWTDDIGNGQYDFGEEFTDSNGNGIWDNESYVIIDGSLITYLPEYNLSNTTVEFTFYAKELETDELYISEPSTVSINILPLNDRPLSFDASFPGQDGIYMQDGDTFDLSPYISDIDNNISELSISFLPEPEDTNDDGVPDINTLLGGVLVSLGNNQYQYNYNDNINPEILPADYIVFKSKDLESESPIAVVTFILNDDGRPLRDDELIAFDQTIDGPEDEEIIVSLLGFDKAVGFGDDLGLDDFNPEFNRDECDSDACYDITVEPVNGTISDEPLDADGGGTLAEWTVLYIPNENFPYDQSVAQDSLKYRIYNSLREDDPETTEDERWSDEATIIFNIFQINDIPVISNIDPISFNEDDALTVNLEVIDPESNDVNLTYSVSSEASDFITLSNDGLDLSITPDENYNGSFSVFTSVTETDGDNYTASSSFDVTVLPVNDAPSVVEIPTEPGKEDTNMSLILSATDIDGDNEFSYSANIISGSDIVNSFNISDNLLSIIPNDNESGLVSFSVTASDGIDTSEAQTIEVNFENTIDFPFIESITPDPLPEAIEDQESIIFTVNPIDFDQDDNLTVGFLNSNSSLFESISVDPVEGNSGQERTFTLVPKENQSGSSILFVTVSDGLFTTTKQTSINILPGNDAPELVAIENQSVNEDEIFNLDLFANDIDGDDLSFSAEIVGDRSRMNTRSGTLSIDEDNLQFIPSSNFFGDVDINVIVTDGELTDSQAFTLSINSINDAPTITSDPLLSAYTLPGPDSSGETYTYQIESSDIDDENLTFELISSPTGMTVSSNGLIQWEPSQGVYTSDVVEVRVSDDENAYDQQIFSISVTQVDCNGTIEGTAIIDDCGVCTGGDTGLDINFNKDCAGECFGVAALDDCGVCSGGTSNHVANSDQDCAGECFGVAALDDCGVCSGGTSNHVANSDQDCAGECFGEAALDDCGVCSGGTSNHVANSDQDCAGECFGVAALDDCGVCSGGTSNHVANSDQDCAGECFGEAALDDCGVCSGGTSNHVANSDQDCAGECFGVAALDDCGVCSGGTSNHVANSDQDCAGECFGVAALDDCGVCSGGTSNHVANSDQDCAGECFGVAALDDCGVCSGGTSNHVANSDQDCAGECFGEAALDDCGVCSGGTSNHVANSDQDCAGESVLVKLL